MGAVIAASVARDIGRWEELVGAAVEEGDLEPMTAASRPQGLMAAKRARSVETLSAKPCIVTQRLTATPMEASLRAPPAVQTPVQPSLRSPARPKRAQARMIASSRLRR